MPILSSVAVTAAVVCAVTVLVTVGVPLDAGGPPGIEDKQKISGWDASRGEDFNARPAGLCQTKRPCASAGFPRSLARPDAR